MGDEVEVLEGKNAGWIAHISSIADTNGTVVTAGITDTANYELTIDPAVSFSNTDTSLARIDRWTRLGIITDSTTYQDNLDIGIISPFLQLKVAMRGRAYEVNVDEIIVNSKVNQMSSL